MEKRIPILLAAVLLIFLAGCDLAGASGRQEDETTIQTTVQSDTTVPDDGENVPMDTSEYPDLLPPGVKLPTGSPLLRLRRAVFFFDESEGYLAVPYLFAAGKRESYVYYTADKGEHWEIVHDTADHHGKISAHMDFEADGLFFYDKNNGILVGNRRDYTDVAAFITADGGRTWKSFLGRHDGEENWENSLALLPVSEFGNDFAAMGLAFEDVFITPIDRHSAYISYIWQSTSGERIENRAVFDASGLHKAEPINLGPAGE